MLLGGMTIAFFLYCYVTDILIPQHWALYSVFGVVFLLLAKYLLYSKLKGK